VRKRIVEEERGEQRLGERSGGGSVMWDACKRGLEGELYDCEGKVVFSQELRRPRSIEEDRSAESGEVEVFDMTESQESCLTAQEEITMVSDNGTRRQMDERDTSPDIPLTTLAELLPPEITSQFEQSIDLIDITDLPSSPPPPPSTLPSIPSPPPIRPKSHPTTNPTHPNQPPNYTTYTLPQLQSELKKYGFKPSKSKPAIISLLQQCHLASLNAPAPTTTQDVSSAALAARVHARITETIKREGGEVYARILRYEPVVVEEMVEWFAGRGLEIGEGVVRGWCDGEGVCCVARESLGGGRRARY